MKKIATILMLSICCGLIFQFSKSVSKPESCNTLSINSSMLMTGDLVFRSGKGIVSEMFKNTSKRDRKFSHAGVIVLENKVPYVYHMIGDGGKGKGGLKKELLAEFCKEDNNRSYAIFRNSFLVHEDFRIRNYLTELSEKHIEFDEHFNMDSNKQLYCSEMIFKMIKLISGHSIPVSSYHGQIYVGIDDLYANSKINKLITYHKYEQIK